MSCASSSVTPTPSSDQSILDYIFSPQLDGVMPFDRPLLPAHPTWTQIFEDVEIKMLPFHLQSWQEEIRQTIKETKVETLAQKLEEDFIIKVRTLDRKGMIAAENDQGEESLKFFNEAIQLLLSKSTHSDSTSVDLSLACQYPALWNNRAQVYLLLSRKEVAPTPSPSPLDEDAIADEEKTEPVLNFTSKHLQSAYDDLNTAIRASIYAAIRLQKLDEDSKKEATTTCDKTESKPNNKLPIFTLRNAFSQRGLLYKLTSNVAFAKKDFALAAKLGNIYAKMEAVRMNPYAALCNQYLAQAMKSQGPSS